MIEIQITDKMPLEKAIKVLKKKLVREDLFKELKSRRYYEKPSQRKRRKMKESLTKKNKNKRKNKTRNKRRKSSNNF